MEVYNIGTRREVCWDEALMDTCEGIRVQMHKPEYRNDALVCDAPWEGNACCYFTVIPDGTHYRLYYRGLHVDFDEFGNQQAHKEVCCYAQSDDGKTFTRVPVGLHSYWGTTDNNIITTDTGDNISFFKDTNPNCPPEELYKGLCGPWGEGLWLYTGADGVHFEKKRLVADDGAYDSLNTCFYDQATKRYHLFYRKAQNGLRAISTRVSEDFVNWSEPRYLSYGEDAPGIEMYTNNIQQYYRAPHMLLGIPTRYIDRAGDPAGFPQMPDWKHRRLFMRYASERSGTAMTDACLMTSRDGVNFRRTDEAFYTCGIENGKNWYYGDCYFAYGMAETASDIPGAPNELSLYVGENYRTDAVTLRRFAIRPDGFFSWHCDYTPGRVVTKPLIFEGDRLTINFATSALGSVRVRLLDEGGTPIEGYDSGNHFGDSVERRIDFQKPLAALKGTPVRLEITMRDAELYSFRFSD